MLSSGATVSNDPLTSGTHLDGQTSTTAVIPLLKARAIGIRELDGQTIMSVVIPVLTARAIGIKPPLIDHYVLVLSRVFLFLPARMARSCREPTTIVKRL